MKDKNRTRISTVYLNATVTLISQIIQVLLGFFIRKVFINTLGVAYLGYNSVFSNILQMLNLADLGIGVAITSFLYKPLAELNKQRVSALMYLYKKIYSVMGTIVLIIGLILSVFLEILIPDSAYSYGYLRILFYINLLGTVSTYFLAYKRTLIIADQKSYITNLTDTVVFFLISVGQLLVLLITPNYIVYLILSIAKNVISNIILSLKANRIYGKFDKTANKALVNEYKPQIISYVKDVFISRIGATIFYGTDNVILSIFKGSLLAGYLSNYTLITTQLSAVVNQVLAALQATFGNYINSDKSLPEQKQMTDTYFCVNFCIGNFCMVCFMLLAQPFVKLFFGNELLLNFSTVVWLSINFMLSILIQLPSQVFTIYKLFRYDKPIIIVSAALNIIVSVLLVGSLEIDGVLIGTFVTSLIYLFSRFYIISKYVYHIQYGKYVYKIIFYFIVATISALVTMLACYRIEGETVTSFIVRVFFVGILAILIPATILSFTKEFEFVAARLLPRKIRFLYNKLVMGGVCAIFIVGAILMGRIFY